MRWTSRLAAQHSALWDFDRWYRLWWYIWPASLALLISGWICVDKPAGVNSSSAAPWGRPVPNAPPQPIRHSPILANWPEKLHNDVMTCFSNAIDLNPLVEACTQLIDSGQAANPQLVAAYTQRGFLRRLKEPDVALADFNSALSIQADAPAVLTNRAFIYITRGRYDAALADLNKAIELFPPAASAHARYYRGFTFLKRKEYPQAMSDLNDAVKLDPNNPDPYLARGELEQAQQQYDAALRDYDEFSKRAPRNPRGLIGRGSVLEATGSAKEALAAYESAVALEPANAQALAARDRLRAQQNSADQAK
jgi:tetratricopeptide (TPR) repeat protein